MKLLKKHPTFLQVFLQSLLWNCFVKTVLYCGTRIGRKSFWCFATLSAKFRLLSKAAKTPSCWKCCCQQQTGTKKFLTKGAKIQQHGVDFALANLNILFKDFYCLSCLLVKAFAAILYACRFAMHNSSCTKKCKRPLFY